MSNRTCSGFYLEKYNFSIRIHKGMPFMFSRMPEDREAHTPEEIATVESFAELNRQRCKELKNDIPHM